jgi:hypothetical protein
VLVVEAWPFPDGAIPSRVAIPQRYPPPLNEVVATAPTSGSSVASFTFSPPPPPPPPPPLMVGELSEGKILESRNCDKMGESCNNNNNNNVVKEEEVAAGDAEKKAANMLSSYMVLQGGLVATGGLPYYNGDVITRNQNMKGHNNYDDDDDDDDAKNSNSKEIFVSKSPKYYTWKEAIEACDKMLTCLSFSYLHPTPLLGNESEKNVKFLVEFKREASPIRIKGNMDVNTGTYGVVSQSNGIPRWTAVKPFPLKTLLNEWVRENTNSNNDNSSDDDTDGQSLASSFTTNFRECEEWALDGQCNRLNHFMNEHCNFFCRTLEW